MAFRVKDAALALQRPVAAGVTPNKGTVGPMELNIPAIEGIGGSLIYLVDRYTGPTPISAADFHSDSDRSYFLRDHPARGR